MGHLTSAADQDSEKRQTGAGWAELTHGESLPRPSLRRRLERLIAVRSASTPARQTPSAPPAAGPVTRQPQPVPGAVGGALTPPSGRGSSAAHSALANRPLFTCVRQSTWHCGIFSP